MFSFIAMFSSNFAIAADAPSTGTPSAVVTIQPSSSFDLIEASIIKLVAKSIDKLQSIGILWLSSFIMIQFLLTNMSFIKNSDDIGVVIGKLTMSIGWFGVCFYIIQNGPTFINKVGDGFFSTAAGLVGASTFDAGNLIDVGVSTGANVITTVQHVAGLTDVGSVILAGVCAFFVLLVVSLIAFKVFMLKIELALVVMISPLSFAFLGLNSLKDQGLAPFKSLISLMYRTMLIGVVISAMDEITKNVTASLTSIYSSAGFFAKITGIGNGVWPALLGLTISYLIIGYLAFKSDSIASSLASGSTNLGTSDVATAAAMGAAAGAAVVTGGASAASIPQAMGNFMKGLPGGGGGSISDASSKGAGSTPTGASTMARSLSKSSGGSQTGGSPASGGSAESKSSGSSTSNSAPRSSPTAGSPAQNAVAMAGTAQNAADGVAAAGGSQAASDAAATAALAGGSNEAVSAAVVGAGGTVAQGAAAATAMAVGEAGGSAAAMMAGAKAVGAGKNSAEVGQAVMDTVSPGSAFGQSSDVGAAAASASRTKPAPPASAVPGSGDSASIGGAGTSADQNHDKLMAAIQQQGQPKKPTAFDHLKEFNDHLAQEKAATHVSINANAHDH